MTWDQIKILFAVIFLGFLYSLYSRNRNKKSEFTRPFIGEHFTTSDDADKQFLVSKYYKCQITPGGIILTFCFVFSAMLYYDIIGHGFSSANLALIAVDVVYGLFGVYIFYQGYKGYNEDRIKPVTQEFLQELRKRITYPSSKLLITYFLSVVLTVFLVWLFIVSGSISLY